MIDLTKEEVEELLCEHTGLHMGCNNTAECYKNCKKTHGEHVEYYNSATNKLKAFIEKVEE